MDQVAFLSGQSLDLGPTDAGGLYRIRGYVGRQLGTYYVYRVVHRHYVLTTVGAGNVDDTQQTAPTATPPTGATEHRSPMPAPQESP